MTFYKTNFLLIKQHGFSLTELENMMPWERDVYLQLLENFLEEKKKKRAKHG